LTSSRSFFCRMIQVASAACSRSCPLPSTVFFFLFGINPVWGFVLLLAGDILAPRVLDVFFLLPSLFFFCCVYLCCLTLIGCSPFGNVVSGFFSTRPSGGSWVGDFPCRAALSRCPITCIVTHSRDRSARPGRRYVFSLLFFGATRFERASGASLSGVGYPCGPLPGGAC